LAEISDLYAERPRRLILTTAELAAYVTTELNAGTECFETDGAGNILDWWLWDGTAWNH
jgi:6-phosphogluconolactonase (cycloisomerase 2 family)